MGNNKCSHLKPEEIPSLKETDSLKKIYERQAQLQEKLGRLPLARKSNMQQKCLMVMEEIFHINSEMTEMLERLPFKNWKNYSAKELSSWVSEEQRTETLFEFIDVLHFFLNIALIMGFSPEEIFYYYIEKNKENFRRQDDNY